MIFRVRVQKFLFYLEFLFSQIDLNVGIHQSKLDGSFKEFYVVSFEDFKIEGAIVALGNKSGQLFSFRFYSTWPPSLNNNTKQQSNCCFDSAVNAFKQKSLICWFICPWRVISYAWRRR